MPIPFLAAIPVVSTVWGAIPGWAKIAMGGALALFVTYQVGHWKGDNYRNAIWEKQIAAEREKQNTIVTQSDTEAVAAIIELHAELENRNAQINELLAEADKDPNAARPALGVDSVRRINRIGPRRPNK